MHSSPTLSLNWLMWKKGLSYVQNTACPWRLMKAVSTRNSCLTQMVTFSPLFPFTPSESGALFKTSTLP